MISLLVFGVLILVHELGHYFACRWMGVSVKEFAIGMGPKLISKTHGNTVFSLRALPIGGFVKMAGEDEESDDENAFGSKPVWRRFIVLTAGSFMNLILGFILMAILVFPSERFPTTTIDLFRTAEHSTERAGLRRGDTIERINGKRINIYNDLLYTVGRLGTEPVDVTVTRVNERGVYERVVIHDVSFPTINERGILFGVLDFYVMPEDATFTGRLRQTFFQSVGTVELVWTSLYDLITGRYGIEAVSGPIGITTEISNAAQRGGFNLLFIVTLITINLGMMNLLPLPALDGGRIVFLLIEFVRRKPMKPEYEGYIHMAGMALLLLFMVFVTYRDIVGLIVR